MTSQPPLMDPFELVAGAIRCARGDLTTESAMYRDHGWDSFGHLQVILAMEKAYGIQVGDGEITLYATMKAIQELHERLQEERRGA